MSKRILAVVSCAYRATLEEQDDPILWITRAMRGAGGALDVLLSGNAVSYGVRAQDASGLRFGERRQTQPPRLADDTAALIASGATVHYAAADARDEPMIILLGDPNYYGRFGFEPASRYGLEPQEAEWEPAFQVRRLTNWREDLRGKYVYSPGFDAQN